MCQVGCHHLPKGRAKGFPLTVSLGVEGQEGLCVYVCVCVSKIRTAPCGLASCFSVAASIISLFCCPLSLAFLPWVPVPAVCQSPLTTCLWLLLHLAFGAGCLCAGDDPLSSSVFGSWGNAHSSAHTEEYLVTYPQISGALSPPISV